MFIPPGQRSTCLYLPLWMNWKQTWEGRWPISTPTCWPGPWGTCKPELVFALQTTAVTLKHRGGRVEYLETRHLLVILPGGAELGLKLNVVRRKFGNPWLHYCHIRINYLLLWVFRHNWSFQCKDCNTFITLKPSVASYLVHIRPE